MCSFLRPQTNKAVNYHHQGCFSSNTWSLSLCILKELHQHVPRGVFQVVQFWTENPCKATMYQLLWYMMACRLNCHKSTISRIVNDLIDIMHSNLGGLVHWPDRESSYKTMPVQFLRTFGEKVAVVIDCFKVFCRRPTSLEARAQTWSNYKHHKPGKFLIGITPCGAISYLLHEEEEGLIRLSPSSQDFLVNFYQGILY